MTLFRTLRSLRDHERGVRPDAAWVRSTRETLLMQVRNTMPTAEVAARHREPFFVALYGRIMDRLRGPVLATVSIVGVVLGGSIASVSAAEQALPGDTLYSVKLVTEQARLALTGSKSDKVVLKAEFTKRRAEELKAVVTSPDNSKKEVRAALAVEGLKRDLDTLKNQLEEVQTQENTTKIAEAVKTVDKSTVELTKTLSETKESVPAAVKETVAAAQAQAVDVGIKALEVLVSVKEVSEKDGGTSTVSSEDIGASLSAHAEATAQSLATTKALSGTTATATSSSSYTMPTTSTVKLVQDAEASLATVQQLASEQKLGEAVSLLKDVTMKSLTAQKQAEQQVLTLGTASSSAALLPNPVSASSTPSGVSSSSTTPAVQGAATTTSL